MDRRRLLIAVTLGVVAAVAGGLLLIGTPGEERQRRLDETRVSDLMALRGAVTQFADKTGHLPASLEELAKDAVRELQVTEPESGRPYGYEKLDDDSYRLCATFEFATRSERGRYSSDEWAHRAGTQCFRFDLKRRRTAAPLGEPAPVLEDSVHSTP